jgi:hypothetical protein
LGRQLPEWESPEIVGVAGDTNFSDVTAEIRPALSLPPRPDRPLSGYAVRASRPEALAGEIRTLAVRHDPNAIVVDATTLEAMLGRTWLVRGCTARSRCGCHR